MNMMKTAYVDTYPYIYRGIVEDNVDPEYLGRCRVRIPFIHGELEYPPDALPWARPLILTPVDRDRGSVKLPDIKDVVWVFFEGGDKKFPVYLGGTHAEKEILSAKEYNIPELLTFYLETDKERTYIDSISYQREDRVYQVKIGDTIIKVTPKGIYIEGCVEIKGDVRVKGTLTVDNLVILGHCNREGGHG